MTRCQSVRVDLPGGRLGAADARVVDREVQRAVGVHRVPDDALGVLGAGGVLLDGARRATGAGDLAGHPLGALEVDVGEHHAYALGREVLADRLADAGAAAGDDRDLPVEPVRPLDPFTPRTQPWQTSARGTAATARRWAAAILRPARRVGASAGEVASGIY